MYAPSSSSIAPSRSTRPERVETQVSGERRAWMHGGRRQICDLRDDALTSVCAGRGLIACHRPRLVDAARCPC